MSDIGLFEAIYSARSIRRLKPDPVPEALITAILDAAIRAPSGGNAQSWAFMVVRDPDLRRQLGATYRKASDIAEAIYAARGRPAHMTEAQFARLMAAGKYLWDHMGEAPVLLIPCARRPSLPPRATLPPDIAARWGDEIDYAERIRGASIYPAVQNILLACRGLGLGTVITTNHIRCQDEVKALLGIPEDVSTFALMPIGWPIDGFGPLTRRPLAKVAHADRWGVRLIGASGDSHAAAARRFILRSRRWCPKLGLRPRTREGALTAVGFVRLSGRRVHYAWIVLAVMFSATLAGVGVRAAPGVMIVPLERAFGWDVATISGAVSLNIILLGASGPFLTGLIEVIGLKRTILACMMMLIAGAGLSNFMTAPWQLFLTWGLMVGIGSGAGAMGIAAAIANRWFARRNGLAMGLLTSANAAGQLVFLPLLAMLAQRYGWQGVSLAVTSAVFALLPLVAIMLPESPASLGLAPYGAAAAPELANRQTNPFSVAMAALFRAAHSFDFWLLSLSFAICGLSTNGLINTHLIAYCADRGIPEVGGAGILASLGVFSLLGAAGSGWLCDRFNPRVLLSWYYGLRGLSLVILPFTQFDVISLSIFAIFYGLDWVATGPATFTLTNQLFGRRDAPVIISWIFAGHQVGGALAALGAGAVRSLAGDYLLAFMTSGLACLMATLLVLRVSGPQPEIVAAV